MKRVILFCSILLFCWSSQTSFARSTYNAQTRELSISHVIVDGVHYQAGLIFDGVLFFALYSADLTLHSSDLPASYNPATGLVTIPYAELHGFNIAYAAALRLVTAAPALTFELTALQQISVIPKPGNTAPTAMPV